MSVKTLVITTFSEDGYNLYGKKFIDTWCKYWPENYILRIYAEHELVVSDTRVEVVDLHTASPELVNFKEYSYKLSESTKDKKLRNNYYRTVKWCHKVYAIKHALQDKRYNHLIFLDADTETTKQVPENTLEPLTDNCLFAVHFESIKGNRHYETGLIIFNYEHHQIQILRDHATDDYNDYSIYKLSRPWDGFWFPILQQRYNLEVRDLADGKFRGVFTHPDVKNILVHKVGKKKYHGTDYNKYTGKKKGKL